MFWQCVWVTLSSNHTSQLTRRVRASSGFALALLLIFPVFATGEETLSVFSLRAKFVEARESLRLGQTASFRKIAEELNNYRLRPYLDYYYLNARVTSASVEQMTQFFQDNPDLPVTPILRRRWLKHLGRQRQWRQLLDHYTDTSDAELRCYQLRALFGTGEKETALSQTGDLWTAPVSQPKACDPLFEVWRQSDHFGETVAWQRLAGAIAANQRTLARYLIRYFDGKNRQIAQNFYNVHVNPTRVAQTGNFRLDTPWQREAITHGIIRLAGRDPQAALKAWEKYRKSHEFSEPAANGITEEIAVAFADEGVFPNGKETEQVHTPDALLDIASAAIKHQRWLEAQNWINRLPPDKRDESQWRYWLARAMAQVGDETGDADGLYSSLAGLRHYYGFLAARELGVQGQLNAADGNSGSIYVNRVRNDEGIARSLELFAVGDDLNGRREWYKAINNLTPRDQVQAAELAMSVGMVPTAIRTANLAEATDHLHLRFPLAHEPAFRQGSLVSGLSTAFLIAIARQESALQADARSTANARGLMQLLPSTARLVARRAKKPQPTTEGLYDPQTNIELGSYHLAWLVERYDQQTPLAIAAYNAGEHRVDRWIKEANLVPMDVWIETIPFRETRNYVKNVLAFRHVYSQRLGTPTPMLSPSETLVRAQ